jgi:hypothetical protein
MHDPGTGRQGSPGLRVLQRLAARVYLLAHLWGKPKDDTEVGCRRDDDLSADSSQGPDGASSSGVG